MVYATELYKLWWFPLVEVFKICIEIAKRRVQFAGVFFRPALEAPFQEFSLC